VANGSCAPPAPPAMTMGAAPPPLRPRKLPRRRQQQQQQQQSERTARRRPVCTHGVTSGAGARVDGGSEGSDSDSVSDLDMELFLATACGGSSSDGSDSDAGDEASSSQPQQGGSNSRLRPMPVAQAQRTQVVRVQQLLGDAEIAQLLAFHARVCSRCGQDAKKHGPGADRVLQPALHTLEAPKPGSVSQRPEAGAVSTGFKVVVCCETVGRCRQLVDELPAHRRAVRACAAGAAGQAAAGRERRGPGTGVAAPARGGGGGGGSEPALRRTAHGAHCPWGWMMSRGRRSSGSY
jgi:hypothetical protein